jgi:hypothetical protein
MNRPFFRAIVLAGFFILPMVTALAQRGVLRLPVGAEISIPRDASICADTIFANNPGYGTLTLERSNGICSTTLVIPVEFLSLTALHRDGSIALFWRTASETNCAGYEVQRADVQGKWNAVAFIPGSGTTMQEHSYSWVDVVPTDMREKPFLVYRLRQIDYDGTSVYSPEVRVSLEALPATPKMSAPYPNPAHERVYISYSLPAAMTARLTVYSVTGEIIAVYEGVSYSDPGVHLLTLNTTRLSAGMYFVELLAGATRHVQSFVVRPAFGG